MRRRGKDRGPDLVSSFQDELHARPPPPPAGRRGQQPWALVALQPNAHRPDACAARGGCYIMRWAGAAAVPAGLLVSRFAVELAVDGGAVVAPSQLSGYFKILQVRTIEGAVVPVRLYNFYEGIIY